MTKKPTSTPAADTAQPGLQQSDQAQPDQGGAAADRFTIEDTPEIAAASSVVEASPAAARATAPGLSSRLHSRGAAAVVSPLNIAVSRLVSDEDVMELHTREAMLLFLGKAPEQEVRFGVPGARHAAGALRQLFVLTARDNPYAELVLIDMDERAEKIKRLIKRHREAQIKKLDEHKAMGLSYSIIRAQKTQPVSLGYHSPYGYMMSTLIVMFDECVRVLKSAERRDLLTRQEQHAHLYEIKHAIRSLFEAAIRGQRILLSEQMKSLSRADFLPQCADPDAAKRVQAAQQIFGAIPQDLFAGRVAPRHTMRKERITEAEQKVLDQVASQLGTASDSFEASHDESAAASHTLVD